MALATHKETGIPFAEDIEITADLPHTLSFLIMYTSKLSSFNELSEDKKPPRGIWDKSHKLRVYFDKVFKINSTGRDGNTIEFDPDEVE